MSEDKPPGKPFDWGLRPGGDEEPKPPAEPEPVDIGFFAALDADDAIEPGAPTPAAPPASWDQPTVATPVAPPAAPYEDLPTEAMPQQEAAAPAYEPPAWNPWEPPPLDDALEGASNALVAQPVGLEPPVDESAPTSAIDSLFGESSFQEYEAGLGPSPFAAQEVATIPGEFAKDVPKEPRAPLSRSQKTLIWVAGGLVAAIALTGLFFAGRELAPVLAPAPVASPSPTPTPSVDPGPVPETLGPVAAGVYAWDELLGTECLDPYTSPWEEEFTVVDCAAPHAAQLVFRGRFDDPKLAPYPGIPELQARMSLLCTSGAAIDYPVASQYGDIQFAASFAADEADWAAGSRDYFCFVSRSTGEPLGGSVALPDVPTPVIPVEPAPEP